MISALNNFSYISFGSNKKPTKHFEIARYNKTDKQSVYPYFGNPTQKLLAKKTTIIPQKDCRIKDESSKYYPNVDEDAELNFKYIEEGSCWANRYSQFSKKFHPTTLEVLDKSVSSTHISNEYPPFSTVAISGRLEECFTTDGLWQCAGVALIDKKHNLQTLAHICPMVTNEANKNLLDYILSFSKPEDLEIYIAPGMYEETDKTIEFIVDTIKNNNENYNINFVNFPNNQYKTLVLQDGELRCTKNENNRAIEINPEDRIINA